MPDQVDVLIVGAGFAGLGMAIALRKAGRKSFLVIEKGDVAPPRHGATGIARMGDPRPRLAEVAYRR